MSLIPATDIAAGLRVSGQLPLDTKQYFLTEAELIDLGTADNLAYTYYRYLTVQVAENGKRYTWEEVDPISSEGLMTTHFVYPAGHTAGGIDYGGKSYNWLEQTVTVAPVAKPFVILKKTGNQNDWLEIGDVVLGFLSVNLVILARYDGGPINQASSFTIMQDWAPENF